MRRKCYEKGKCKNNHCSAMSNIAWCELDIDFIKRLHEFCTNRKCKCQRQISFTPKQFSNGRRVD